jgi:hypothetical protein
MNRDLVELIIDEEQDLDGVYAMSLVTKPAMQSMFVALSEEIEVKLAQVDTEKQIVVGAALIPNKKIYRKVQDKEFDIFFSEETIEKISWLFFKNGNQSNVTLQHDKDIDGQTVVESWIVKDEEKDKQSLYGFNYPKGTWMIMMKIDNPDVWGKVKSGEVKGFSIEGKFADKWYGMQEEKNAEQLINSIMELLKD